MSNAADLFIIEANEHLKQLEEVLMEMEEQPNDKELINQAFRSMHTIKGSGSMFGYDDLSAFTHHIETAFDKVRNGEFSITADLISVILDSKDHIESLLEDRKQTTKQAVNGNALLDRLNAIIPDQSSESVQTTVAEISKTETVSVDSEQTFRIRVIPAVDAFADSFDALPILHELKNMGDYKITTNFEQLPELSALSPEKCLLSWDIILHTKEGKNAIEDTFIFVQDDWNIDIEEIGIESHLQDEKADLIGNILIDRGDITVTQIKNTLSKQPKMGEILKQAGLLSEQQLEAALAEQGAVRETKKRQQKQESNIRVPVSKLDSLMDLVGELVIVQARLSQLGQDSEEENVLKIAEDLSRLTTELRDNTFDIRMLPIGTTFSRFRRLVRDLSRDLGKEISLVTEGAETELDKVVIDRLSDPLIHLIRNSIDHGIEMPEQREALGKPRKGTIHLSAEHSESHVIICIRDDGGSMNAEKLKAIAIEKGVIQEENNLSEQQCYNLIFAAGFSTAKEITDISGRGVGMDVVKRSIQELRGDVSVDCEPGVSTTITINLPMTLAIIEGLLVSISGEHYVLPLSSVEECIELETTQSGKKEVKSQVEVRGELVPFVRLREWFNIQGEAPDIEQIVLTHIGDNRFGFSVDEVIGQYQTVIKKLGKIYDGVKGLAGATILGDGSIALILDVKRLITAIEEQSS